MYDAFDKNPELIKPNFKPAHIMGIFKRFFDDYSLVDRFWDEELQLMVI